MSNIEHDCANPHGPCYHPSHQYSSFDELVAALDKVCKMYENATGLPAPSQAQRLLKKYPLKKGN